MALESQITGGILTHVSLRFEGYIMLQRFLETFSYDHQRPVFAEA